jgi:hypothetical protein
MLDDTTCQLLADPATTLADFGFCFRKRFIGHVVDLDLPDERLIFIEELRRRILLLSVDRQPLSAVESDGCGLTVWF